MNSQNSHWCVSKWTHYSVCGSVSQNGHATSHWCKSFSCCHRRSQWKTFRQWIHKTAGQQMILSQALSCGFSKVERLDAPNFPRNFPRKKIQSKKFQGWDASRPDSLNLYCKSSVLTSAFFLWWDVKESLHRKSLSYCAGGNAYQPTNKIDQTTFCLYQFWIFEYLNIWFYQFWILGDPQLSLWLVILPQLIHDTSIILSSDHLIILSSYHPVFLSSCHHRLNPPISGCTARETNPISFSPRNWIQLIDFPANWCAPSPHQRASGKLISRSGLRLLEVVHGEILISRNQLKYWSVETSWSFGQ